MAGRIPTKAEIVAVEAKLTSAEADLLDECERTIERGKFVFTEIGQALTSVRDNRLYRAKFGTFEDYCQQRWEMSRPRAYELMKAAAVVSGMPDNLPPVQNPRQAAALAAVPEAHRADVWSTVLDATDDKPTAAAIEAERKAREAHKLPSAEMSKAAAAAPIVTPDPVSPESATVEEAKPAVAQPRANPKPIKREPNASAPDSDEAKAQEFMKNFNGALVKAGSLFAFDTERVALLAEQGEMESLERHVETAQKFLAEVKSHRPTKFRLYQGGAAS